MTPTPEEILANVHKSLFKEVSDDGYVYELIYREEDNTYWRVYYQIYHAIDYDESVLKKEDYMMYYSDFIVKPKNSLSTPDAYSGITQVLSIDDELLVHGLDKIGLVTNEYGYWSAKKFPANIVAIIVKNLKDSLKKVGFKITKVKK